LPFALGAAVLTCAVAVALAAGGSAVSATSAPDTGWTLVELRGKAACDAPTILEAAGAVVVSRSLRLYRLETGAAARVLPSVRACGAVRYASPDRVSGTLTVADFSDPLVPSEWWRAAVGVADLAPPGPGKPVTIIDSGVSIGHPEFTGRADLVMLNEQQPQPIGGVHGTAVASVIGGAENGVGIVGIYPQAVLQSWDAALGQGTQLATSDIVAGMLAAAQRGPGVINLSLGGTEVELPIQQAVATAVRKGMLIVAAAGNDGDRGSPLTYPASLPHVLTVAATDQQNRVPSFSSRSRFVDLAAPGVDITVASALDNSWDSEDGTSFASPIVAGAAAWTWTARPTLDAGQLFEIMRRSATDIDTPGRDDASGYGLLDVPAALATPAPVRDPLEPNDDIDYVKPGATFDNGIPALTTSGRPSTRVVGRITVYEDSRDVYRVFVPRQGRITVKTTAAASVNLGLWGPETVRVTEQAAAPGRLARSTTKGKVETITFRNAGAAKTVYLAVTLAKGTRDATYPITVTAR
jgi:subtilisin family serine protease